MWFHTREIILFLTLGVVMAIAGIRAADNWEFWVILITALLISINCKMSKQ